MTNEHSNGAAIHGGDGDEGIIAVGLAIQALGATLVETGRLARKTERDQRRAEVAKLVPLVAGLIGDLEILRLGLRASLGR